MPSILGSRRLRWVDEAACAATASSLAARPALKGARIELNGPLGAGKTTFVRHLLRALGVEGRVKSPTYALLETYRADAAHGGFAIAHFDFYRFDDAQEWEDAGFRDVFAAPGLKLVEWPDKAAALLPPCDLRLVIVPLDASNRSDASDESDESDRGAADDARDVGFDAMSALGLALLP